MSTATPNVHSVYYPHALAHAAYTRATGTTRLLAVALRYAHLIADTFGPTQRQGACGHPEVAMRFWIPLATHS